MSLTIFATVATGSNLSICPIPGRSPHRDRFDFAQARVTEWIFAFPFVGFKTSRPWSHSGPADSLRDRVAGTSYPKRTQPQEGMSVQGLDFIPTVPPALSATRTARLTQDERPGPSRSKQTPCPARSLLREARAIGGLSTLLSIDASQRPLRDEKRAGEGMITPLPALTLIGVETVATDKPRRRKIAVAPMSKTIKTSLTLDVDLHSRLSLAASLAGLSNTAFVTDVLRDALRGLIVIDKRKAVDGVDSASELNRAG